LCAYRQVRNVTEISRRFHDDVTLYSEPIPVTEITSDW
jgi:hypothetical protein